MSVELENVVQLYENGVNYGKIGVSKRIADYSADEILNYLYAGVSTEQFKNFQTPITGIYEQNCTAPIKISVNPRTGNTTAIQGEGDDTGELYCKVIWCYTGTHGVNLMTTPSLDLSETGVYIITNMDARNIVVRMTTNRAIDWGDDWSTRQASSFSDAGKAMDFVPECYYQDNGAVSYRITGEDEHRHLLNNIAPFLIVPAGGSYILLNAVFARIIGGGYGPITNEPVGTQYNYLKLFNNTYGSFAPVCTPTEPVTISWYTYGMDLYGISTSEDNYSLKFWFNEGNRRYFWRYVPNTHEKLLKYMSRCGVFIFTDRLYKPVINGGYISGFSENTDTESDIDNYTYASGNGHTVPVNPPSGGGGTGDELTDMLSRAQFYGSGLTKYYVDVPAAKLQKALGDWDNIKTGKDVLQNLLSYKILCFPSTTFSNGMTDSFVIAGIELKDENDNTITAKRLTSTGAVNLPNITISPTFNDFRDYAPYTKIQMFVPLCGWFDLPPWCMGRKISGEMYINPYSGTVRCLVRADGNVVAELGGNAAIDLPFNATAVGMKSAAVLSNLIQTAGAVGSAVMLPTVNTLAGAGSAALGAVCAMNANYTESKGTMGDGSNVYGLYNVYIKITRPATVDNSGNSLITIPAQYCHDYGRPCNKQLTLTAGDGYTQIMDANITGAMTDREKQMIIDGFRHGLIL